MRLDVRAARTPATMDELRETFAHIDANGDGGVSFAEFRTLMHDIGDLREDAALRASFERVDVDQNGRIDFAELCNWLCPDSKP
jgi:Ca2+-binding EF-hand superfamily protein